MSFDCPQGGYSPAMKSLLWPPAWEARANEEGWSLRVAGQLVEVDLWPPRSAEEPIYHDLIGWIVLNVALGSVMHLTAWTFEYAANESIYLEGRVPGDGMYLSQEEDGSTVWVDNDTGFGIATRILPDGSPG